MRAAGSELHAQWSSHSAPFDDAGKAVVLDDASGHWESGELAVISTCPLKNVSDALEGVSVCRGTTVCRIWSYIGGGTWVRTSRNVLPRERSEPCFPAVGGTSESALMSSGSLRNRSNTPESSGVSHGTLTREFVTSSSAEVTVPSTCPLQNTTNTRGSSGELHGTIRVTQALGKYSFNAPLVSGSHLFGVCVARGVREIWTCVEMTPGHHLYVHLVTTLTCSVPGSPEEYRKIACILAGFSALTVVRTAARLRSGTDSGTDH